MHKKFYRALEHLLRGIDASAGDEPMLDAVVALLVAPEHASLFGIASGRIYRERALDFVLIESIGEYGESIEGKTVAKNYPPVQHLLQHRLWLFRPDSPGYDAELEAQFSHMNNAAIVACSEFSLLAARIAGPLPLLDSLDVLTEACVAAAFDPAPAGPAAR